jgi:hypothetical protein
VSGDFGHPVRVVDSLRSALAAEHLELLSQLGDDVVQYLDRPINNLTADDFNVLRDKVGDVLIRDGFEDKDGDAVNDLGRRCEDIIDRLAPWHWGKDERGTSA